MKLSLHQIKTLNKSQNYYVLCDEDGVVEYKIIRTEPRVTKFTSHNADIPEPIIDRDKVTILWLAYPVNGSGPGDTEWRGLTLRGVVKRCQKHYDETLSRNNEHATRPLYNEVPNVCTGEITTVVGSGGVVPSTTSVHRRESV
jgi:hypothetical protein